MTDDKCDAIYVSSYFAKKASEKEYPGIGQVYTSVKEALEKHGLSLRELTNTQDVWARDYMPVQITANHFWEFTYEPDYLQGDDAKYITDYRDVTS